MFNLYGLYSKLITKTLASCKTQEELQDSPLAKTFGFGGTYVMLIFILIFFKSDKDLITYYEL